VRKRCAAGLLACALLASGAARAFASDDASAGYEAIRPSLVKVWAFDAGGRPIASGTGLVVASGDRTSSVLTASHVIAGAASLRVDVSSDLHDLAARVQRAGPRDLTLLSVERGGLHAARFAPAAHAVVSGNLVAVAGYVKNDELIGVAGQQPRVLFPGTVSARPDDGAYLELENVHVEEGLSGGPVFDPVSGEVLGIITSRTTDARGGFADSAALVVLPFLDGIHVAVNVAGVRAPAAAPPPPRIVVAARVSPPPPMTPLALPPPIVRPVPSPPVAAPVAKPVPVATVVASLAGGPPGDIASWQAGQSTPKRFTYVVDGCTTAVVVAVRTLQFVVAHHALVPPHQPGALLDLGLRKRVLPGGTCTDVPSTQQALGAYEATAMSFDGRHVTMRFTFAGDPSDAGLFPSDASLDADLDDAGATATLQFFDRNWTGALAVPLGRTALASVSSGW
jgi:hypothetical protein